MLLRPLGVQVMNVNSRVLRIRALLVAGFIAVSSSGAAAQSSPFTPIDVTGAGTGTHQGTAATAIDAAGDVTGIYIDISGNEHAFVVPMGGAITPFDASGTGGKNVETIPIGFDSAGDVAGIYLEPYTISNGGQSETSHHVHGFLRTASNGAITLIDVAGEDTGKNEGTFPICINSAGAIAGNYSTTITTASGTNSFSHGFVRSAAGAISTFDAVPLPTSYGSTNPGTYVVSINATGEVAGLYIDGVGAEHGFLRDASGGITLINPPNAGTAAEQGSAVTGIDAAGDVIGAYMDSTNVIHGFVRNASTGAYTVIDAPGAGTATYQGTYPDAFDAAGDVSGSFTDANNVVHGFVLPANGSIVTYDAPGSTAADAQRRGTGVRLDRKLRQLGKSYGLSIKSRRANSPLNKLKSLLSKVGAVKAEGTGLLNGNGPNPSGTASYGNLILNGVNPAGEVIGLFTDGDYVFHGYLRAANGTITTLDDPDAGTAAEQGTSGLAINASGVIAGTYADANSVLHGFIFDSSTLTATTTTLSAAPNPSVFGQPVTLTASVSSTAGTPPNGENVTFMSGATSLGTAELSSGVASLTSTVLPTGTDSITAVYAGDANFGGSTSTAASQVVGPASTSTTLTSSLNPSTFGQAVNLTATVNGQFSGIATGTVIFSNGSTSLGSASLSANQAAITTTALPVGTDTITSVYSGDTNFTGSTSNSVSQVVNAGASAPVPVASGISPGFASAGGAAFTLTVTGSGFAANSTVYWGTTALTTTFGTANQLTAQVTAADIANGGIAVAITVVTPAPGGGTSNPFQFEVDSASGATTAPLFSSVTETVAAGSSANYPVTLPSTVESATVTCLNLPTGGTCSYSASTSTVTIATTSATPAGTYQVTVVFTETVSGGATSWILLPILLLPLVFLRRRLAVRGVWVSACLGLVLLACAAVACVGCGGGSSSTPPPQTHLVVSSGSLTLIVQ